MRKELMPLSAPSKFAVALLAAFLAAPMSARAEPAPVISKIAAHPTLWVVHSGNTTAYLLGSIHLLPQNVDWHTQEIDQAIAQSDTFVFEAPMDDAGQAAGQDFIRKHGTLPPDVSLPSLLGPRALKDYRRAVALTHMPPETLDHLQPWLAAVYLELALIQSENFSPDSGVDRRIFALARAHGKSLLYFETVEQQLSLLVPDNPKLELTEFDADLRQLQTESDELGPMIDAWSHGDAAKVGKLVNAAFETDTETRKALLDDRNIAWVKRLKQLLSEPHIYFITVGTGHLVGREGVPALLRKAGYTVDGP